MKKKVEEKINPDISLEELIKKYKDGKGDVRRNLTSQVTAFVKQGLWTEEQKKEFDMKKKKIPKSKNTMARDEVSQMLLEICGKYFKKDPDAKTMDTYLVDSRKKKSDVALIEKFSSNFWMRFTKNILGDNSCQVYAYALGLETLKRHRIKLERMLANRTFEGEGHIENTILLFFKQYCKTTYLELQKEAIAKQKREEELKKDRELSKNSPTLNELYERRKKLAEELEKETLDEFNEEDFL